MRKTSLVLLLAVAACGGDSTTPTASGVFPAEGFTGRTLRVEVSGDATTWKDGATVDFGAGVTVNSVDVASPTDLFADITVDPMAAPGKNDVTVTNSGKKYTLTKAFELVSPVAIDYTGDVAQFGVPNFTINNLDFDNPFDITQDASGAYSNLVVNSPTGTQFIIVNATQYQLSGQVFIDGNGATGPVSVVSGPSGGTANITSVGDTITVMPRTATPFTGTATGNFADLGSSAVYGVTASGNSILHYTLTASDQNASPASAVLGAGGSWNNDFLGANHLVVPSGTYNVVVVNLGGMGYTYTLTGAADAVTATAEGNDTTNKTPTTAPSAAIPYELTPATLSSATDTDYYKVVVMPADANKALHITTDSGNPETDTAVDVTNCATTNTVSYTDDGFGGSGPIDGTECSFFSATCILGEDVVTKPLPAGTYCIEILAGANGADWSATTNDYTALWWLE